MRLLFSLHRSGRSGVLEVQFGKRWRRYLVLGGDPIAYDSDQPEEQLEQTLVQFGVVPAERMKWLEGRLGPNERIEDALAMAGIVTAEALANHRKERLDAGIAAALRWATGRWTFSARDDLDAESIDPALLLDPTTLHALWVGVRQHVSMDDVLPKVTALGELRRAEAFEEWFPHFAVEAPFDDLPAAIGASCTVDELYRRLADRSGNLVKLLWLLDAAALFDRPGQLDESIEALLEASPAAPRSRELPKKAARRSQEEGSSGGPGDEDDPLEGVGVGVLPRDAMEDLAQQVRAEHKKRMGADYYAFLGLDPDVPAAALDRRSKRLANRWRAASQASSLDDEVRALAHELLTGAHLVWRTLSDPSRRTEYDRRMAAGQAPLLRAIQGASKDHITNPGTRAVDVATSGVSAAVEALQGGHVKARRMMEDGDFRSAIELLRAARLENPSHPDILADLGWATWKVEQDADSAEEYLQLALTFDGKSLQAVTYLGKLAMERGDEEGAQKHLARVLKLDPGAQWARRAMAGSRTSSADVKRKSSPGLRFWRKGEG